VISLYSRRVTTRSNKSILPRGSTEISPPNHPPPSGKTSASNLSITLGTKEEGALVREMDQKRVLRGLQPTLLFPPMPVLLATLGSKPTQLFGRDVIATIAAS
jgi:hypothetical protein